MADFYIWSKLLHEKINLRKIKTYIIYTLLCILLVANYFLVPSLLKVFLLTIIFMPAIYFLFNLNASKSIITAIVTQLIYIISEFIFTIIYAIVSNFNLSLVVEQNFGTLIVNILITLIAIIIVRFKFIKKLYKFLSYIANSIKPKIVLIGMMSFIIVFNIIYGLFYYGDNIILLYFVNAIVCIVYGLLIFKIFIDRNNYVKVYNKYNTTLYSLREYEDILDKYKVSNHENKNQLLMIRNMSTNKKIINYIDKIVDNNLKDNEKLMVDVSVIPEGGLRGLIYSKLLYMKENNINSELNVDKKVRTDDLINIDHGLMLDICKIIGVFIDNAIEEVNKLNDKYVEIDIYHLNGDLNISVSNNYGENIDITKIDEKGYTTKGKGHGYGLALVKEIIDKNKYLENNKSITENTFTQILKIKL